MWVHGEMVKYIMLMNKKQESLLTHDTCLSLSFVVITREEARVRKCGGGGVRVKRAPRGYFICFGLDRRRLFRRRRVFRLGSDGSLLPPATVAPWRKHEVYHRNFVKNFSENENLV